MAAIPAAYYAYAAIIAATANYVYQMSQIYDGPSTTVFDNTPPAIEQQVNTTLAISSLGSGITTIAPIESTSTSFESRAYGNIRDWVVGAGNNPNATPPDGYIWKGNGTPETGQGTYTNPTTGEYLHPDLNHGGDKGAHWGYRDADGNIIDIDLGGNIIDNDGNVKDEYTLPEVQ